MNNENNLKEGLYEQLINQELEKELAETKKSIFRSPLDLEEAPKILSQYVAEILENNLEVMKDKKIDLNSQIALINQIVSTISDNTQDLKLNESNQAEQLLGIASEKNQIFSINNKKELTRPETSIAQSSLFTGSVNEPKMFSELKREILSSDRIDLLVSFIKWSGLRLIMSELEEFTKNGGKLRIITTTYMGASDYKAIKELSKLPNTELKISYETKSTRLHAKSYIFYRDTGFSTAYIGSSNLSNPALSDGLEWNVKITNKDLPETIKKVNATFESYWNSDDFELYDQSKKEKLKQSLKKETYVNSDSNFFALDVRPYPFQQEILDNLEAERNVRGNYKNLVIAATGTGKTVISALDYKRFVNENPGRPNRLLFIAHREEILKQSLSAFRSVLKDPNFGELFVGNHKPDNLDHLFMSIQTFNSQDFSSKTSDDFYDFIIVDEFHHAAAPTYQKLLTYYNPKILLGLTATPERMDGKSVFEYFDNKVAAEIRLPEAIERNLLCPFQYFGVTDTVDLNELRWTRGGYDKSELINVYSLNRETALRRADHVVSSVLKYVTDINEVKGLGFCVSIEHAQFMSEYFNERGIKSIYLTGSSPNEERNEASKKLKSGEVKFIFVVDLYNEGVDIPEINTVLFLRPTESLTIFLQQLGRGLRLSENKECLTVLDFIGQANRNYDFENKYKSLLVDTSTSVAKSIKNGFKTLPKGCFIELERKASEHILNNIQASYGKRAGLINKISNFQDETELELTLENFLSYYHLNPLDIYHFDTFSKLKAQARVLEDFNEPAESILSRVIFRLSSIDSRRWIRFLLKVLPDLDNINFYDFNDLERRMFQMFYYSVFSKSIEEWNEEVKSNLKTLTDSPNLLNEIIELLKYNYNRIDFVDRPINLNFECPLDVYCTYTRDQILLAFDFNKPSNVREGVKWLKDKNVDLLFITLNKSDKDYSPTTLYNDYSINNRLFHWQSQSTTSENSQTGKRYINHNKNGSKVLLFVRENKKDPVSGKTSPYTFLGDANYVSHQGEKPMNITWQLENPIPVKYLKKTNKLMTG